MGATARELVREWAPRLAEAGIDTARLDTELLVAHGLGIERDRLLIDDPEPNPTQLATIELLMRRRSLDRVPVAYLVGERWFDGLRFFTSPGALVPRPETELLVELAAALAPAGATTLDVGTGSGAVAVALAVRRPDLVITASDIDDAALDVARVNAALHGVDAEAGEEPTPGRVALCRASLLGDWRGEVVVSNPPYVEDAWREQAEPELAHEPPHALYAGADGLDVIRPLIAACADAGVGLVLLEHGHEQGEAIRSLFKAHTFRAHTERDLAGHDRVTWALRGDLWPPDQQALRAVRARWS